jgi:hypothetical protein
MQLGLSQSTICIHPHNDPNNVPESSYGVKILGSYVGSPDYIKARLQEYVEELSKEAEDLIAYPDLQGRWLMFLRCYTKKPYYMFRTITPALTVDLQKSFELLKKKILYSLLCFRPDEELDNIIYNSCNFPIQKGGLGLHDTNEVARSAFVSSMIAFSQSPTGQDLRVSDQILRCIEDDGQLHPLCSYLKSFRMCVQDMKIPYTAQLPDELAVMKNVFDMRNTKEESVQSVFTNLLADRRLVHLKDHGFTLQYLAWFTSLQNETAGKWLEMVPKYGKITMTNLEFQTALRFRLQQSAPNIIEGARCDCKYHSRIDRCGHHLVSGCNADHKRSELHDLLVVELQSVLRYSGCWSVREEHGCFLENNSNDRKRPDISIYNPINSNIRKELVDVSITCPIDGCKLGVMKDPRNRQTAQTSYRASKATYDNKVRIYGHRATALGFGFQPFIFESSGAIDPRSKEFLLKYAKKASEVKRIPLPAVYSFFVGRLSVCLQKGIARSISGRLHKLNSHTSASDIDQTFSYLNVAEVDFYRA